MRVHILYSPPFISAHITAACLFFTMFVHSRKAFLRVLADVAAHSRKFGNHNEGHRAQEWTGTAAIAAFAVCSSCIAFSDGDKPNLDVKVVLKQMADRANAELQQNLTENSKLKPFSKPFEQTGAEAATRVQGMPVYRLTEVAKHNNATNGVWVCFGSSVYDVTDFVNIHPGGNRILLAAGGPVEPYWKLYAQHNKAYVLELLERYRIGLLHPEDVAQLQAGAAAVAAKAGASDDPYANDPQRHPALQVRAAKPYNAEPPGPLLVDSFLTPVDIMFTRHHMPVPTVKAEDYRLTVKVPQADGTVREVKLTLADLKSKFPRVEVTAAIQCAGNRRSDMQGSKAQRQARGLAWQAQAIANVHWAGVRLSDVLQHCGVDTSALASAGVLPMPGGAAPLAHVQMEGLDADAATGTAYGASVPLDLACDPKRDAILAYEMNGQELNRDHGYPVRAVFPGIVAARSVKWLGSITLSHEESHALWQRKDYKVFPPWQDWDKTDWDSMPAMQEMPVSSAICDPPAGPLQLLEGQTSVAVKGWAWSGGGRGIARVEISADGGRNWMPTEITASPADPSPSRSRSWGWTLWRVDVPLPQGAQEVQLAVRAMDVACNSQAADPQQVWNWRGLANNSYHSVTLQLLSPKTSQTLT